MKPQVRAGEWPEPVVRHAYFAEDKAVDPDAPLKFIASTESLDRYGDIVRADGWELENYLKNPIVLFGHNHSMPVGTARVWREAKHLMAEITLAMQGTSPAVDATRALVQQRVLRAVSVSFLPKEWEYLRDEKNDHITGYDFKKHELLENSLVSVPANPEALSVMRSVPGWTPDLEKVFVRPAFKGMSARRARVELTKLAA